MLFMTRTHVDLDRAIETEMPIPRRPRRASTMMEYLLVISLILVACLIAIGFLGDVNNGNMTGSANSINKSLKKGS